jgi:nickel-dependent lactate racemase
MKIIQSIAPPGENLSQETILNTLHAGLAGKFSNQRLLVLVPDFTRSLPLPMLFKILVSLLEDTSQLDFLIALGTHLPLDAKELGQLFGIDPGELFSKYRHIHLLNHNWSDPGSLETIGVLDRAEVIQIAGDCWHPSLGGDVLVQVNKIALEYDHILILGPTFPHEVVGFSGGAKYLFPGISGPEMINVTHWLGALSGVVNIIGVQDTPVRAMIHAAAVMFPRPITLAAVVVDQDELAGIFIGDLVHAWRKAADLSAQRHIRWCQQPFQRVLSCPSPMYGEMWTASKAMYKLEPVIHKGGEIIIYAPHLDTISHVHGHYIYEAGYHILPYLLENWDVFKHIPLGVLAHLTHLRGTGVVQNGVELPDIRVTLASKISQEDCDRLNLGYLDPASIDPAKFMGREQEGLLYVPKAGEILYRLISSSQQG